MPISKMDRVVLGDTNGKEIHNAGSGDSKADVYTRSQEVTTTPRRRSWLRIDTTDEEDSITSTTATTATARTDASMFDFPPPPSNTNGAADFITYKTHDQSSGKKVNGNTITNISIQAERNASMIANNSGMLDHRNFASQVGDIDKNQQRVQESPTVPRRDVAKHIERAGLTDFFGPEVYQIVLRNPATAYRLTKFCQNRACGENMEFLEKVDKYHRLLDELTQLLGEIHSKFTGVDASRQINIPGALSKRIATDIKAQTHSAIPGLDEIFREAQDQIENLLATDIYPRFVQHQVTISATLALTEDASRYQGLGDCFCLTDPSIADNPILYASDGFVDVTGYDRRDIVPRNCRFLQGSMTDKSASKRLRTAIDDAEEIVELLLNYRKNGEPFWNLLYVAPLYGKDGKISFFLGGQIDCSTTIHSCTDVLKVLSLSDDEVEARPSSSDAKGPTVSTNELSYKSRSSFFKSLKMNIDDQTAKSANVQQQAGMEKDLVNKMSKFNLKSQVEAFYTAYSKYLVMSYEGHSGSLIIHHYSRTVSDLLCLDLSAGSNISIFNKDIFRVFSENQLDPDTKQFKAAKQVVREAIRQGKAVSAEMGLLTGTEIKKAGVGGMIGKMGGGKKVVWCRAEERFVMHWTPLKDEDNRVKFVVLTIAPKS